MPNFGARNISPPVYTRNVGSATGGGGGPAPGGTAAPPRYSVGGGGRVKRGRRG